MKNQLKIGALAAVLTASTTSGAALADGWTNYMTISANYIEGVGALPTSTVRIVLIMNADFHTCGWSPAANLNNWYVGDSLFKVLSAAALAAITSNKRVALATSGCDGDRANIIGLRIEN
jgi:hypothetical protein